MLLSFCFCFILFFFFLRNIEDSNYAPVEAVLCKHLGILRHEEVVDVFKNFHDKAIKHGDDKSKYEEAVSKMRRRDEYKEDFTWRFCSPSSLSSSISSLPRMELVKECLHHFGNKAEYKGGNGEILRYCANMAKHLSEHIEKVITHNYYCVYICRKLTMCEN